LRAKQGIVAAHVVVDDVVSVTEAAIQNRQLKVRAGEAKLTIRASRSWRTINGESIVAAYLDPLWVPAMTNAGKVRMVLAV